MPLRSIVCLYNGGDYERSALATAVALAKENGAHLRVIHAVYIPRPYSGVFAEAAISGAGFQEMIEQQVERELAASRESAAAICADHGLPFDETGSTALPRVSFVAMEYVSNRVLLRDLSVCDLIILGAQKGTGRIVDQSVPDLAVFSSGRPVLVVRANDDGGPVAISGAPCAIAWNGSPESVRALIHGRAVYESAGETHLVVTKERHGGVPTDDQRLALDYLAAHGIAAELDIVDRGSRPAAEAILERVRALGCGYIAMGAYGHSIFREMMLGGFSEYMLEQAEMPLLLAH